MAVFKNEAVWKILSKYRFDVESHSINDLTCVLCQDIVKDCRQTLCGCRYCLECISNYLDGGEKICPGSTIDCRENIISITMGIQIDHVANMKISRLVVQCPIPDCHHREELRSLEDHFNSHSIDCPYSEIGCDKTKLNTLNIEEHLKREGLIHSNLLIGSLQQMRNEWILAKHKSENETQIINSLRNEINHFRSLNESQKELIRELEQSVLKIKDDILTIKNENKLQKNLDRIERKLESKSAEIDLMINKANQTIDNIKNTKNTQSLSIPVELPPSSPKYKGHDEMEKPTFRWEIKNFSSEQKKAKCNSFKYLLSDPFYSHPSGYKLCLVIWPNGIALGGNKYFTVGFHLMKGKNDCNLNWPMMKTINISLMDQESNQTCKTLQYSFKDSFNTDIFNQFSFSRPSGYMNRGIKTIEFMRMDDVMKNYNLYKNDMIVLTCSIS